MPSKTVRRSRPVSIQVWATHETKRKALELAEKRSRPNGAVISVTATICDLIEEAHQKTFSNSDESN